MKAIPGRENIAPLTAPDTPGNNSRRYRVRIGVADRVSMRSLLYSLDKYPLEKFLVSIVLDACAQCLRTDRKTIKGKESPIGEGFSHKK